MNHQITTAFAVICLILTTQPTFALTQMCLQTRCAETGKAPVNNPQNCGTYDIFCYGNNAYKSCTSCKTGYELKEYSTSESSCARQTTWNNCEAQSGCDGTCGLCVGTIWRDVSGNSGYQSRTNATCNTETCVCTHTTEYRCAAGYYGAKPSCRTIINVGTVCSGCTACPDVPDKVDYVDESYRITSDAGDNESIEKCYIDGIGTDNFIADKTGHYTVVGGKCYYSE